MPEIPPDKKSSSDAALVQEFEPKQVEDSIKEILKNKNLELVFNVNLKTGEVKFADLKKNLSKIYQILTAPNNKVNKVDFGWNDLDFENLKLILKILKNKNNKITNINLGANRFGVKEFKEIAKIFNHPNCKIKEINLSHNFITYNFETNNAHDLSGLNAIKRALMSEKNKVKKIDLTYNSTIDIVKAELLKLVNLLGEKNKAVEIKF